MNSKALSLKDKKLVSEKLRNENKKMEVRLQQLKLTMSREKEERLLSGNASVWSTSAPGALLNYKPNLSAIDMSKKVKLKVLKEEDMAGDDKKGSSERANIRKMFAGEILSSRGDNIYKDELNGDRSSNKRKCGQCEETVAVVNCKECTEIYCAKCFATFHLKGALRKHRSTPISNITNRVSIPSPLFKAPDFNKISNNSSHDDYLSEESFKPQRLRDSKENQSPKIEEPSLANGCYNEALSKQYFQDALTAWRNGEEAPQKPLQPPQRSMSEHSTETSSSNFNQKLIVDSIKFTPSLSYAEQLLLRKHRSCQLEPVEMKYILNKLARNSEAELLENQRLLQCNFHLETSVINSTLDDGILNDNIHVDIGSLNQLWSDVASLERRDPSIVTQQLSNSHFVINDLVPPEETNMGMVDSVTPRSSTKESNESVSPSVHHSEEIQPLKNSATDLPSLKLTSRRTKSALNRANFNDRPQSSRKMSARSDKGGKITTKPSILLEVLASFNEYLPDKGGNSQLGPNYISRFNSAGTSRSSAKVNYNFYKIAPQSWKPSQAWSCTPNEDGVEINSVPSVYPELEVPVIDEYEEELNRLNFDNETKSHGCHYGHGISPSSSDASEDDEDLPDNVEEEYYNKDEEEQEAIDQLQSFDRELTLMSRKKAGTHSEADSEEDVIADSLDFNDSLNLLESDKFQFEDSLDFQQRFSNNSAEADDDLDDEIRNCSSRFNDCEDVGNLV